MGCSCKSYTNEFRVLQSIGKYQILSVLMCVCNVLGFVTLGCYEKDLTYSLIKEIFLTSVI